MKKLLLAILAAGSLLAFNACTKTGPQGPQGVPGPSGQTGPQGPQGNANVIGSSPFNVSSWALSAGSYKASFDFNDITSDVVNGGIVEVFKYYSADDSWTNLPDINGKTSTVFNFYLHGFDIYVQNSDGTVPAFPGTITFRAVAISPSLRQAHPNTNWKDYNQAMAAMNATVSTSEHP
jgi:hypothetical protein